MQSSIRQYFHLLIILLIGILISVKFLATFIGIDMTTLVVLTSFLISVELFFSNQKIMVKTRKVYAVWYAFFILLITSYWRTRAPIYGFDKLYVFLPFLVLPVLWGKNWVLSFKKYRIAYLWIFVIILISFYFTGGLINVKRLIVSTYFRLGIGEGSNPIVIATFLGYGIIIANSLLLEKNILNKKPIITIAFKAFLFILIVFATILMFITGSKGPILAIIAAYIIYYLVTNFNLKLLIVCSMLTLISGFILTTINIEQTVYEFFPQDLHRFIKGRFFDQSEDGSVGSRLRFINMTFSEFSNKSFFYMLFGNGVGDFGYVAYDGLDIREYPHNIFLEILHEVGILGFGLFTFLIYYIFQLNRQYRNQVGELKWLLILFYFFFFRSLTTGDLQANFAVFVHLLLLLKYEDLMIQTTINKDSLLLQKTSI